MTATMTIGEERVSTQEIAGRIRPENQEMTFGVAHDLDRVIECWGIVYDAYRKAGLIDANPVGIHTSEKTAGPQATVLVGQMDNMAICTMSTIYDHAGGLPLDAVYHKELQALRRDGHQLMEVGLFADRRGTVARSITALMELMRHVFYIGLYTNHRTLVIGIHPHHAAFYMRYFDFVRFAPDNVLPSVNYNPVVPLMLDLGTRLRQPELPKGLTQFLSNPLSTDKIMGRCDFDRDEVEASPIGEYLRYREMLKDALMPQAISA